MFSELASVPKFLPPKYTFYFSDSDVISISLPLFFYLFWLMKLEFFKSVIVKLAKPDLESIIGKSHLLSLLPVYIVENIKQWNLSPVSGMLFFSRLVYFTSKFTCFAGKIVFKVWKRSCQNLSGN